MRQRFNTHDLENKAPWQSVAPSAAFVPPMSDKSKEVLRVYLAAMRSGLDGLVELEKEAVLEEMRQHLLASAKAFEELGDAPDMALQNALAAFGSPLAVGSGFTETYQTTGAARQAFPAVALRRSLRVFSRAMAVFASLMLFSVFLHQFSPEWAQSPLGTFYDLYLVWIVLLIMPVVLGVRIGLSQLPRAVLGSFYALALLTLGTIPLMLPNLLSAEYAQWRDLLALIPVSFVYCLVIAPLAAHLASLAGRRRASLPCRAR